MFSRRVNVPRKGPITRMPRITRTSSMNRCRAAAGCASTQPMYRGAIDTIQNFTPPRLTMSSARSLGDTRSSFVTRTSDPEPTTAERRFGIRMPQVSRGQCLEDVDQLLWAPDVEARRGCREPNTDGECAGRKDGEQALVRSVVPSR